MTRTRTLIAALCVVMASGIFATGCVVRARGQVGVASTTRVVYEEPPAPQPEVVTTNAGHVWIRGHWEWRNGAWVWAPGRWERERSGYAYTDGRWERRGNSWHWVDGDWVVTSSTTTVHTSGPVGTPGPDMSNNSGGVGVSDTPRGGGPPPRDRPRDRDPQPTGTPGRDVSNNSGGVVVSDTPRGGGQYPTAAPPPPRTDSQGAARTGYIWVRGRWNWVNSNWEWVPGHWERQRANSTWVDGRWELQGNYYVWVEGRWDRR